MDEELYSEGSCLFCEKNYSQDQIAKHLAIHLGKMAKEDRRKRLNNYFHVGVEAQEMFLQLLVRGDAPMKNIDRFLRDIWLDCCGHLSNFGHKNFKINMQNRVEEVFQPRTKIYHDYDYGTTTRVFLRAYKQYLLHFEEKIILLSRNEPLKLMCASCQKKPAVNICTVCMYEDYAFFCEKCSEKHAAICEDFADFSGLPVVNSPRMGECGYTGGRIDVERDGVYKKS